MDKIISLKEKVDLDYNEKDFYLFLYFLYKTTLAEQIVFFSQSKVQYVFPI